MSKGFYDISFILTRKHREKKGHFNYHFHVLKPLCPILFAIQRLDQTLSIVLELENSDCGFTADTCTFLKLTQLATSGGIC